MRLVVSPKGAAGAKGSFTASSSPAPEAGLRDTAPVRDGKGTRRECAPPAAPRPTCPRDDKWLVQRMNRKKLPNLGWGKGVWHQGGGQHWGAAWAQPATCRPATVEGWVPQVLRERAENVGPPPGGSGNWQEGPAAQWGEKRKGPQTRGGAGAPGDASRRPAQSAAQPVNGQATTEASGLRREGAGGGSCGRRPRGPAGRRAAPSGVLREQRGAGPWRRGSAPHVQASDPRRARGPSAHASASLGLCREPPGSCRKGGATGLAHVRRVWRAAAVGAAALARGGAGRLARG